MKKKKETGWDVFKKDVKRFGIPVVIGILACFVACETTSSSDTDKKTPVLGVYATVEVMTLGSKKVDIEYSTQSKSSSDHNTTTPGAQRYAKCVFKYKGNVYQGETFKIKLDSGVPMFTTNNAGPEFLIRPDVHTRQTFENKETGEMAIVSIETTERISG